MRRGGWGIVAALAALGAVGAAGAAREAFADAPKVAACGPKQAKWFQGAPASTAEFVYGSGAGATYEDALASARVRAAEAIGVEVRSSTVERQPRRVPVRRLRPAATGPGRLPGPRSPGLQFSAL